MIYANQNCSFIKGFNWLPQILYGACGNQLKQTYMKNILIADDTTANLNAAKEAALQFPQYEFSFTSSAKEAIEMIVASDAVITDLFFEEEVAGSIAESYGDYIAAVQESPMFTAVVKRFYNGNIPEAKGKLEQVLGLLSEGKPSIAMEELAAMFDKQNNPASAAGVRGRLLALVPQFPFGGALMLKANSLKKPHCLVSNIHRHAGITRDAASSTDAMILLMPLMEAGVATVEQVLFDGKDCLTYIGEDEIRKCGGEDKTIRRVSLQ